MSRDQHREQEHDREGRDESGDFTTRFINPPGPSKCLPEDVACVQRDFDGGAEASDAERQSEERDCPPTENWHEHPRGLLVGVHLDVLGAEHDGGRDQAAHGDRAPEAHAQKSGQAIDPQVLFGPLLLERA